MSLVTVQDFQQMGKLTMDQAVSALVKTRIIDTSRPMPPASEEPITADEVAVLTQWMDGGMPAGAEACNVAPPPAPGTGEGPASTGTGGTEWSIGPGWPGGVAPEEKCYQFLKHGGQSPDDTSPHMTELGETYVNFFYKVPWTEPSIATRWRTVYDNTQVLHHWLLYNSGASPSQDGKWASQVAGGLLGLTAGLHGSVELVAGWAVGGDDENFPEGVGLQMPAPGRMFELEWHLYNTTGTMAPDRSGIEICVVPESAADPKYVASLTWLGTEDLDIKPNGETKRGGMCTPAFKNGGPISIIKWLPHMHTIGIHMDSWVLRADGTEEHVFSEPFQFDRQISYIQDPPVILNQGDRVHSVCTFRNEKPATVLFGQSTDQEMCYQFVFAFPAGSLTGVNSAVLTGARNGCLSGNVLMEHSN